MRLPTLGDLAGRIDRVAIECAKCPRRGEYDFAGVLQRHGAATTLNAWIAEISADCPFRQPEHLRFYQTQVCGARCMDLARVL